jgi:capsular polysaccharide transport system permease protein
LDSTDTGKKTVGKKSRQNLFTLLGIKSKEEFIHQAYESVLGRPSDPEGFDRYLQQLDRSKSRLKVLADLKLSKEGEALPHRVAGLALVLFWVKTGKAIKKFINSKFQSPRIFLFTVVAPTTIACLYFGLMASDVYISESRFVIRSPQRQAPTGLGAVLQGVGFSRSQDDTYSVHDFMSSRDALSTLDQELQLRSAFGGDGIDRLSRFNGLGLDNSFEALYRFYQKHITLNFDSASSISSLQVRAFTPEDAFRLNQKLLEMGEEMVNRLNERGRLDLIRFATDEVAVAEQRVKDASQAVSNYRSRQAVFDPEKQSALHFQQISKLQDELIATRTLLAQMQTFTSENPQIASLKNKIESLQRQIDAETAKITGGDHSSLASKSVEYEHLILERAFAEKQLATVLAALEQARNDAQRKQLYLERIVQPSKPDMALEPRRLKAIASTLALGLITWGILTMLVAGVREHQD